MKQNNYISKVNSKTKKIKKLGDTKSKLFFHATSKQKQKKSTTNKTGQGIGTWQQKENSIYETYRRFQKSGLLMLNEAIKLIIPSLKKSLKLIFCSMIQDEYHILNHQTPMVDCHIVSCETDRTVA